MFYTPTDQERLAKLLERYNEQPSQRDQVIADIEREFQQTVSMLVLDTCSFSRSVRTAGIVHLLALFERLERLVVPLLEATGGRLLRREADNLFAVFPDATAAVEAAAAVIQAVKTANGPLPASDEIYVSIGIGYGSVLVVGKHDLFGDEMNLACKLGEDLARESEVLLTTAAYEVLDSTVWRCEEVHFSVSGIDVVTYRLMAKETMPTS
jgi:adenylate cyclase